MFEELDIINDQINVLSDSFHMLTYLQILKYEETQLEILLRHIIENGAKVVVQFMIDCVANRGCNSKRD